ncbi:hypothetical protein HYD66_00965 [Mycoplasmopsis bovis]|nr:hypothetical protein [Mycoplasmopsis bovis]QQH55026.1 hypothetical protein HYD66_00965 [Mycoplasmopsis bovis]
MVKNSFNSIANSWRRRNLDKLTYAELIKKTIENMADLQQELDKNIYKSIHKKNLNN